MSDDPSQRQDRVRRAIELLVEELGVRLGSHPWGHLLAGRSGALDLSLSLPLTPRNGTLDQAAHDAGEALAASLQAALTHRAVVRPGRVFCLRCGGAECEHSAPAACREVFAGYGKTGLPRWIDLGQWLLERQDPHVDLLYREPPQRVVVVVPGEELTHELLPAYRDHEGGYRLHGQVMAGWYRAPDRRGLPTSLAVSFQLISSQTRRSRRRFALNVAGVGPDGEELANLWDRIGAIPWQGAVGRAHALLQRIVQRIERTAGGRGRAGSEGSHDGAGPRLEARLSGLLQGLAHELERGERGRDRRTGHGERRHHEGDRPTRMALADLHRAGSAEVLRDTRSDALVVLGERGRAHVFNAEGKLVTSIRYSPEAIARRRDRGQWRPAPAAEVAALKARVAAAVESREEA